MAADGVREQDNARVNRADGKCKIVKLESDTMGGTTIRRLANPTA